MKRPHSQSPPLRSKRPRRVSSPIHEEATPQLLTFQNEAIGHDYSGSQDHARLVALEMELANYASSIKSAQARHTQERRAREANIHSLVQEHLELSDLDNQELQSLQQLYAGASGRLIDYLKKAASSRRESGTVPETSSITGTRYARNGTGSSLMAVEQSAQNSVPTSSRTVDYGQMIDSRQQSADYAANFLNTNTNLAEALAQVQTPHEASQGHLQEQLVAKPTPSAKALWERSRSKPSTLPEPPTHFSDSDIGSNIREKGRLTPIDSGARSQAELGEVYDEPQQTSRESGELYDGSQQTSRESKFTHEAPDPYEHIPRLCPIALAGQERCPHGRNCRLWKRCERQPCNKPDCTFAHIKGTCKFMAKKNYCNHGNECRFGHDHIEQRRESMARQQEHYETAK